MKQASITNTPVEPTELSPEFLDWLEHEKADSTRRMTFVQASILIFLGTALFLLKQQPDWFNDIFGIAQVIVHP